MNERIETTEERAKETRKFVEKMITYAKKGDLSSRSFQTQLMKLNLVMYDDLLSLSNCMLLQEI